MDHDEKGLVSNDEGHPGYRLVKVVSGSVTPDVIALLESNGWEVECLSPLEVRHVESGSFASGLAAKYTIQGILEDLS